METVPQSFRTKRELIDYCNQHGYAEKYGHALTYYYLNKERNKVDEFLDALRNDMEFLQWMNNVEVEEPTQKPHEMREAEYNIVEGPKSLFKEPDDVSEFDIFTNYLEDAFEKLAQYVADENLHDVDWVNLEPTVSFQSNEKVLGVIQEKLLSLLRTLLETIKTDKSYMFEYQVVDEKGNTQNRFIHLTPENTKLMADLLKDRGLIISDVKHFDPYEDEDLPFPSWAIIKQFKIRRHLDRFGKAPTDRFKPRQFTGERKLRNLAASENGRKQWTPRGGNFFRWHASSELPKALLDQLKRYQIITKQEKDAKKILKDSCAIYAFIQAGIPEEIINRMRLTRLSERFISLPDLEALCKEFNIALRVRDCERQRAGHHNNEVVCEIKDGEYKVNLCYFKEHYFLDEKTPFTLANVSHALTDKEFDQHIGKIPVCENDEIVWRIRKDRPNLTSFKLIEALFDTWKAFIPYTYAEFMDIPQLDLKTSLEKVKIKYFNEKYCCKNAQQLLEEKKKWNWKKEEDKKDEKKDDKKENKKEDKKPKFFYADFETDTGKLSDEVKPHEPYLVCWSNDDGTETGYFEGETCGKELMDFLPNHSIVVFHNLKYDINFLAKYFDSVNTNIARGKTQMLWNGTYSGKSITLKDSASLLPMHLDEFPKMFNLETGDKEKMPYNYVTYSRYINGIGDIKDCGKYEDKRWGDKDYEEFNESLKAAEALLPDNHWDIKKYVRYYCHQDVRILREGFNTFSKQIHDVFQLNAAGIHSASSLAYQCIMKNVLLNNPNIFATSGLPDTFIRQW